MDGWNTDKFKEINIFYYLILRRRKAIEIFTLVERVEWKTNLCKEILKYLKILKEKCKQTDKYKEIKMFSLSMILRT